jgi:hypothetical protein
VVQNYNRPRHYVFREPGGDELWGLASRRGPQAHELANGLRLSTTVLSQDLSGAWAMVWG